MSGNVIELLAYPALLFWGAVLAAVLAAMVWRVVRRWEERR